MKLVFSKHVKKLIGIMAAICLLIVVLINVIGYVFNCKYISVVAAVAQADKYEVRSELLLDAMDHVGVCTPQAAIQVWAEGMKSRNGAMQYSVMDEKLKKVYMKQLEQYNQYWVTGVSSPWIESYQITNQKQVRNEQYLFQLSLSTETSTGFAGAYKAQVAVNRNDGFWQITKITADKGLYPYMGLK